MRNAGGDGGNPRRNAMSFLRLFRFYRQSGLPFFGAIARAWAKRK